jgi:hypothetical protein
MSEAGGQSPHEHRILRDHRPICGAEADRLAGLTRGEPQMTCMCANPFGNFDCRLNGCWIMRAGNTYTSAHTDATEREAKADLAAARRALVDFEKRGGTSLEDLRKELGL